MCTHEKKTDQQQFLPWEIGKEYFGVIMFGGEQEIGISQELGDKAGSGGNKFAITYDIGVY